LFLCFLFLSIQLSAQEIQVHSTKINEIAHDMQWLRLVHYKKKLFGGYESNPDSPTFFIAVDGKTSPESELMADINAFKSEKLLPNFKWHPQCHFPARYIFIKKKFPEMSFKDQTCEDFTWWKNRINAKSISVIFSSYYPGNAASFFGHTFLKLNSKVDNQDSITDFALDFAAATDNHNFFIYAVKGLLGGYPGFFSTPTYYEKINQYAHLDSRDLWEYRINLTQAEVDWFVTHVWELKMNTYYDYYFLTENCSYMLLEALDVVRMDQNVSRSYYWYAMPIDTIRRIDQELGIAETNYRPSAKSKLVGQENILNPEQFKIYLAYWDDKESYSVINDREVLETIIANYRHKMFVEQDPEKKEKINLKLRVILIHRAKLGEKTQARAEALLLEQKQDPLQSHDSFQLTSGAGQDSWRKNYFLIDWRFAIHGPDNLSYGYPAFSQMEILSLQLKYYAKSEKFRLDSLKFIEIMSVNNFRFRDPSFSWGFKVNSYTPTDFQVENSLLTRAEGVGGIAHYFFSQRMAPYILFHVNAEVGSSLPRGWRSGPGVEVGIKNYWSRYWNLNLGMLGSYDLQKNFDEKFILKFDASSTIYLVRDLELNFKYLKMDSSIASQPDRDSIQSTLSYMF